MSVFTPKEIRSLRDFSANQRDQKNNKKRENVQVENFAHKLIYATPVTRSLSVLSRGLNDLFNLS